MDKKRAVTGFLMSFVCLLFFAYAFGVLGLLFKNFEKSSVAALSVPQNIEGVLAIDVPDLLAESAISVEANVFSEDIIIFEKDPDLKLPIASLTKLMTALIVLENYNLSKNVVISQAADIQAPMKIDVKKGDNIIAGDLLNIMIIESSNKAAYALAEIMGVENFVAMMNEKTKEIGMGNTFYADPTGISPKNVSTAKDLVKLVKYILWNYKKIAEISRTTEFYSPLLGKIVNSNQLLTEVPEAVCSKTGFTNEAKGCLLLAVNNPKTGGYLINIILGAEDRFLEMKKIINVCNN